MTFAVKAQEISPSSRIAIDGISPDIKSHNAESKKNDESHRSEKPDQAFEFHADRSLGAAHHFESDPCI
jgi:hypothetical protein